MRWVADEDLGRIQYAKRIISEALADSVTHAQLETAAKQLAMVLLSMESLQQEKPDPWYVRSNK